MWFLRERRERGIRREIGIGIELDEAPFLIVLSFESFGNSVLSESLISLSLKSCKENSRFSFPCR